MEENNKIKELTEKIRKEGLEKAEGEASRIKEEAGKEAQQIKENAEKEAEKILENARREADDYADRVRKDLQLSADQLLLNLRTEIRELLLADVLKDPVEKNMKEASFVTSLLKSVVENWKDRSEDASLEVLLPNDLHKEVEKQFRQSAGKLLNSGVELKPSKNITGGFEIKLSEGGYKISFTDEAFEEFLKESFRPVAKTFLFGEGK